MALKSFIILVEKIQKDLQNTIKKNSIKLSEQKKSLKKMNFLIKNLEFMSSRNNRFRENHGTKINKGFQGLILLPEIGLTGQFEKKFIEFFGFTPAVWHSGVTKKKKEIIWSGISMEKLKLS